MYGGDVRKIDSTTYDLITNPTLLEINSFSSNNMEARDLCNLFFCVERGDNNVCQINIIFLLLH